MRQCVFVCLSFTPSQRVSLVCFWYVSHFAALRTFVAVRGVADIE